MIEYDMNGIFEVDDDREKRLAELAEAIRANRYHVDGSAVADSILRSAGWF